MGVRDDVSARFGILIVFLLFSGYLRSQEKNLLFDAGGLCVNRVRRSLQNTC